MNKLLLGGVILLVIAIIIVVIILATSSSTSSESSTTTPTPTPTPTPPAPAAAIPSSVTGRYVTVKRTDTQTQIINISEIVIYDSSGNKITPIGASLSTTYNPDFPASKLIDGSSSFASTVAGPNEWMKIDLGSDKQIGKVVITNRVDCCQDRIVGCSLIITKGDSTQTYLSRQISTQNATYTFLPPTVS